VSTAIARPYSAIDISSKSFWAQSIQAQDAVFSALRTASPVSWQPPLEGSMSRAENDPGFWAVTGAAEIMEVSQDPGRFSSSGEFGGVLFDNVPVQILEYGSSFLIMDPPDHTKLRKLISAAFTPKRVATIEQQIRNQASQIVDDFVKLEGEVDFVEHVSTRLPMWTMSEMVGVPPEMRPAMIHAANSAVGFSDPHDGLSPELHMFTAVGELMDIGLQLAEQRRLKPEDDLMTGLVQAEVDGERLTDDQISSFVVLLCGAGTDTTRNATSMTMKALYDHWDQWRYLAEDVDGRIGPAVEEFLRWTSPVMTFRRTATEATTLGGQHIDAGDKVVMFYRSGNRDERAFTDPDVFDVTRTPNKHIAFGGRGPHMCLGNNLARAQLRAIFGELIRRVVRIDLGEPEYVPDSTFIRGVKHMPCQIIEHN
jgi:cytochrome P450